MAPEVEPTNGNGHAVNDPELRALASELKVLETNVLLARMSFARAAGLTFGDKRDVYDVLGYKDLISTADYRARYQRGGIAGRVVDVFPNATWRGGMELIEDESKEDYTPFEQAWANFDKRLQVQAKLRRVDKLAGLSTYAILLIGDGSADMEQELKRVKATADSSKLIKYLTPFAGGGGPSSGSLQSDKTQATGADATIFEYDLDVTSPRFGEPKSYQLKRADITSSIPRPVHWSRVIHIAEDLLDDEVFGLPTLERVWNDLDNLEKVTGGGAEAFWLRANQGIHLDVDKDMALEAAKDTVASLKEQMELYKHQMTRALRTRGVDVQTLGSDVANFNTSADAILTQIAGSKGIPKRILTGSEMGELASSQDRENWRDQIIGRQVNYAGPYIVRRLADRLIAYGYLPAPVKGVDAYEVKWPHIQTLTEDEKTAGATGLATINQTFGDTVFTDAEIREKVDKPPLSDEQRKEIDDRAAEKVKQAQEAMANAPQPAGGAPPDKSGGKFPRAASEHDDELIRILADAIECGNQAVVNEIIGLRDLGDVPGHEFHGNQYVSSGAVGGRKGENFVKKAQDPASYGSHYKNINDPDEASTLFEQVHATLEKQGYQRDTPTGLPFSYQREQTFTHPEKGTARLRKDYFAADPVARKAGYRGSSRLKLDIHPKKLDALAQYKLASTQIQLPEKIAVDLLAYGLKIHDADLAADGREQDAHITVKYGLTPPVDSMLLSQVVVKHGPYTPLLSKMGPITVTLGTVGVFHAEDHDVVYVSVESEDLRDLNRAISHGMDVAPSDHGEYVPHATIAYVKPGVGARYAGDETFKGVTFTVGSLMLTDVDGTRVEVGLG